MARLSSLDRRALGRALLVTALALACLAGWGRLAMHHYRETGLFYWVGTDFAVYSAQARAYLEGPPMRIYHQKALTRHYRNILRDHSTVRAGAMDATHVPYPPIFAALFSLVVRLPPVVGFALWTGLNLVAAGGLIALALRQLPAAERPWTGLLFASSFPVAFSVLVGQVQLFVACAVAGFFLLLRARRDLLAGLCLSVLVLKPHYAFLLGVVLVWKRRWWAVIGGALGGAATLLASLVVSDIVTLSSYPAALRSFAGFRADHFNYMISWRALVLGFSPDIDASIGLWLTLGLGIITLLAALAAWARPWDVDSREFPLQVSAVLIASLLASYHSHAYGPAILVVPLAAVLGHSRPHWLTRAALVALFLIPTIAFIAIDLADIERASRWLAVWLILSLVVLLRETWVHRASGPDAAPALGVARAGGSA